MPPFVRDAAATLTLGGLFFLVGHLMTRRLGAAFAPQARLLAILPLGFAGWAWAALGGAQGPLKGPMEQAGTLGAMGAFAWAAGAGGLLLQAAASWRAQGRPPQAPSPLARAVCCLPLCLWPYTLLPPWAIDETTYHLALPWRALIEGAALAPLGQGNGGFFALSDWLGAWGLAMGSVSTARSTQLVVAALAARAALGCVPKAQHARVLCAFVGVWSSPLWLWQAPTSYVDGVVAMLAGVGLLAAARAATMATDCKTATSWVEFAALCVGAAAASKANALALVAPLWWLVRGSPNEHVSALTRRAMCLAALPPALFGAYDLVVYHAPLWPFATPWWPSSRALLPAQLDVLASFFAQHGPAPVTSAASPLWRWLRLPYALVAEAEFASARFDGVAGGVLLCAFVATLTSRWWRPASRCEEGRLLFGCGWWAAILWCVGSWQARFLLPALMLWSLGLCLSMPWPRAPAARIGAATTLAILQLVFWPSLAGHWPPLSAVVFRSSAERIALRRAWSPQSRLCEPPQSQSGLALVWTERQLLWCPQARLADSYDQAAHLDAWLQQDDEGKVAMNKLQALGIERLLINEAAWFDGALEGDLAQQGQWQHIRRTWEHLRDRRLRRIDQVGSTVLWERQQAIEASELSPTR